MNKRLENQIFWICVEAFFFVICLTLLWSCRTTKTITETIIETVHDTIRTVKTDTIKDVKVITLHDTVRQAESHYITLNDVGDTIKEIHHYHEREKTIVVDSTNRYQAKVDSLQSVIDSQKTVKEKIVKKGISVPWWVWIATPLIFLVGLWFIVRKIIYKKWHIS